ncbi:Glypican-5 [Fukomys damarensis]|uniref:Glypican-5 n=1 Tax=Fukomys damarensis TaxID=885580 RepID=A0A091E0D2_FUKDA|nr:Glypican-5 [Fukomys damarensis]
MASREDVAKALGNPMPKLIIGEALCPANLTCLSNPATCRHCVCYTRHVVGNGIKAQSGNPEVKVKGSDPVINQIIDKLKHIIQQTISHIAHFKAVKEPLGNMKVVGQEETPHCVQVIFKDEAQARIPEFSVSDLKRKEARCEEEEEEEEEDEEEEEGNLT